VAGATGLEPATSGVTGLLFSKKPQKQKKQKTNKTIDI
jgi:hypothetical protein